jgi:hypothetical protein
MGYGPCGNSINYGRNDSPVIGVVMASILYEEAMKRDQLYLSIPCYAHDGHTAAWAPLLIASDTGTDKAVEKLTKLIANITNLHSEYLPITQNVVFGLEDTRRCTLL